MITDHSAVNKAAVAVVHELKVTPENNATSDSLKKVGDENLAHLKTLTGEAFDRAHVDHEVTYHEAVIDTLDKTLIPNAKNGEFKALRWARLSTYIWIIQTLAVQLGERRCLTIEPRQIGATPASCGSRVIGDDPLGTRSCRGAARSAPTRYCCGGSGRRGW